MKKFLIVIASILIILIPLSISVYYACIPNLKLNGSNNQKIVLNEEYKELGVSAKDLFGNENYKIKTKGKVDTSKVGNYKIKYTYSNGLINKSVTRNISVIDEEYPIISLVGGEEVFACPNKEYEEIGYSASDNYDGDITDKVEITKTDSLIKYSVKDEIKEEEKEVPVPATDLDSTMLIIGGITLLIGGIAYARKVSQEC